MEDLLVNPDAQTWQRWIIPLTGLASAILTLFLGRMVLQARWRKPATPPAEPFTENVQPYGKVYHTTTAANELQMLKDAGHAAFMFEKEPDLQADIVIWFRSNLAVGGYGLPPTIK